MEPGWGTNKRSQEIYFSVLYFVSVNLSLMHLLWTKLLLAEVLSPALLLILFIFELNQHSKEEQDMHSCSHLQRRKDMQPPVTQLIHFSTSNTYHHFALGNNLASHPQAYTKNSEKCLDNWWIFELKFHIVDCLPLKKKQSRNTQHFPFAGLTVFKFKCGLVKKNVGLLGSIFRKFCLFD